MATHMSKRRRMIRMARDTPWLARLGPWFGMATAFIATLASMAALINVFPDSPWRIRDSETAVLRETAKRQIEMLETQIKEARERADVVVGETARLKETLALLSAKAVTPEKGQASAELTKQLASLQIAIDKFGSRLDNTEKQSDVMDQKLSRIESVILAEPLKALELPLLKRDLQSLQQQIDRDMNALRAENGRVYDLMKWIVGLMALVSLSLIGIAVGNVFKRAPTNEGPTEPTATSRGMIGRAK